MSSSSATSRPLPTEGPSAGGHDELDDLGDLFDYDVGDENDPFSDNYKPPNKTKEPSSKDNANGAGLGIDEEVEVTRRPRAPRVKLDENR
jgi:replication fork protection complex subunit Csm3/Swi3